MFYILKSLQNPQTALKTDIHSSKQRQKDPFTFHAKSIGNPLLTAIYFFAIAFILFKPRCKAHNSTLLKLLLISSDSSPAAVMSAIITAVFKATIGLLVNKGRDKMAERLKDGDVTDQQFHSLIVREIDDIKSKLDGLSRKDLLASISFFKEGIELLYEAFDIIRYRSEHGADSVQAAGAEALSLSGGMRNLKIAGLSKSAATYLANAKKRFKRARERATDAYWNEGLTTSDRILAMQYRVMATILETIDSPANAIIPCKVCIEELNGLPVVQKTFEVQRKTGIQAVSGLFNKEERRKIISGVCHVNRVFYDVQMVPGLGMGTLEWPTVDTGEGKVDPLRDGIITKALRKQGMEHVCVTPWSLGQEGEEEHKLKDPRGIDTNSSGQFIVADYGDGSVKVFDNNGTFVTHFRFPTGELAMSCDVATDMNDNIYVLSVRRGLIVIENFIWIKLKTADLQCKFRLKDHLTKMEEGKYDGWYQSNLSVSDFGKVMVVLRHSEGYYAVEIYDTDGQFVCSFGEKLFNVAVDITTISDDRLMVADDRCVHTFSEHGDHLNKFDLQGSYRDPKIAFHRASERVIVAGIEKEKELLHVQIYSKDGEFLRSTQIHVKDIFYLKGMTVSTLGRIAIVYTHLTNSRCNVLVI